MKRVWAEGFGSLCGGGGGGVGWGDRLYQRVDPEVRWVGMELGCIMTLKREELSGRGAFVRDGEFCVSSVTEQSL